MKCWNCKDLLAEIEILTKERDEARKQASEATGLMMKGEALRERLMFQAIVGDFPPKKKD